MSQDCTASLPLNEGVWNRRWLPGERFQVSFQGVKQAEGLAGLEGEWWVYEEVHSSDVAAFDLQVLCEQTEFRIVANDVFYAAIGERKKKQRQ